jgi:hypothetical protein
MEHCLNRIVGCQDSRINRIGKPIRGRQCPSRMSEVAASQDVDRQYLKSRQPSGLPYSRSPRARHPTSSPETVRKGIQRKRHTRGSTRREINCLQGREGKACLCPHSVFAASRMYLGTRLESAYKAGRHPQAQLRLNELESPFLAVLLSWWPTRREAKLR